MAKLKFGVDVCENNAEPREFLECGVLAENLGFDTFWLGDHFMPWIHTGGKSAYVWSLIGSLLERTERIPLGPDVTAPIGARYHPAIIAQAAATLDNMYPGRFLLGVGSGEAVNEAVFFQEAKKQWPRWAERIERVAEGVELIRQMWTRTDYFSFNGRFFKMKDVYLYTRPRTEIPVYFSAMGPKAAVYAGRYGDHLVTIASPDRCKEIIFPKFEESARAAGKDSGRMEKMVCMGSMIGDESTLMKQLKAGGAGFLAKGAFDEPDPRRVEALAATVSDQLIREYFNFCKSVDDLIDVVNSYASIGADHIVFSTGASPEQIRLVGEQILPSFR